MADTREQIQTAFRQHLRQADKLLIEGNFEEAKIELAKAKKIDPRNPFIHAFHERITIFEGKTGPAAGASQTAEAPARIGTCSARASQRRTR